MMTDSDMVIACAQSMGLTVWRRQGSSMLDCTEDGTGRCMFIYNPLTNDMQAMALVKKFRLRLNPDGDYWWACLEYEEFGVRAKDLNRAIVERVAKMHDARAKIPPR